MKLYSVPNRIGRSVHDLHKQLGGVTGFFPPASPSLLRIYSSLIALHPEVQRRPAYAPNTPSNCFLITFDAFANQQRSFTGNTMPTAIIGAPLYPPPPQKAHDTQSGGTGSSWDDAIVVQSDDDSDAESDDDLDSSRSNTYFPPSDRRLTTASRTLASIGAFLESRIAIRVSALTCPRREICRRCSRQ